MQIHLCRVLYGFVENAGPCSVGSCGERYDAPYCTPVSRTDPHQRSNREDRSHSKGALAYLFGREEVAQASQRPLLPAPYTL